MRLIWNGKDITEAVQIAGATFTDAGGERSDSLELTLENAESWYRWGPEADDRILLTEGNWESGELYLSAVIPDDGKYAILATGIPSGGRRKAWRAYRDIRLDELFRICAAECGMGYGLYGLDPAIRYSYLERNDETVLTFLSRLTRREGARLKTINGKICGVSLGYASGLGCHQTMKIAPEQTGVMYIRKPGKLVSSVTVVTAETEATAYSRNAIGNPGVTVPGTEAYDAVTAGRWARGLLQSINAEAEMIEIESEFNPGMTGLGRMDITGVTDMTGNWIADEVRHDIMNRRTSLRMIRAVTE